MSNNLLISCIFLSLFFQGVLAVCSETKESNTLQRIADPNTVESDVLALVEQLLATPPTEDEAELWAQIANSDKYSDARRRLAVYLLFKRHVRSGMELREVASLLANPTWLKKDNARNITALGSMIPIQLKPGETVFVFSPEFSSQNKSTGIYLRVEGTPLKDLLDKIRNPQVRSSSYNALKGKVEESFCNALLGKESEMATSRITAVVSPTPIPITRERPLSVSTGEEKDQTVTDQPHETKTSLPSKGSGVLHRLKTRLFAN